MTTRTAFTLIELLIVVAILAILAGLAVVGMGPIVHQARVQRSVTAFVQATTVAKELALANLRVYSLPINSARGPGRAEDGRAPLTLGSGDRYAGELPAWFDDEQPYHLLHGPTEPSPLWSDRPEDQWFAVMGPWQDADGRWWQARGGLPRRDRQTGWRFGSAGAAGDVDGQLGGCFGPAAADARTPVSGAANGWDAARDPLSERVRPPSDWATAWRWDPYDVQVGPRRFLERGTRWIARFDCPEWDALGARNHGRLTAAFEFALPAHVTAGRSNAGNEWAETTTFNVYPAGTIDRGNVVQADAYSLAGRGADQRSQFYVGICSTRTRPAVFDPSGDGSASGFAYRRPVAMTWITLFTSGEVVVAKAPRLWP